MSTFSDLARAAYCLRQLYYARRDDDRGPPPEVEERRELAFRYPSLRTATDETLRNAPIAVDPSTYRERLDDLSTRDDWERLIAPDDRDVLLDGRDCRGIAHKLLAGDPPIPVLISPGGPPERGVWRPQSIRAAAIALALAWEREREIPTALVEYPAYGVVRTVRLTTRRRASYRETLRAVRAMDGPPPRTREKGKCRTCDYRETCGVRTRSLRSMLGL